MFNPIPLESPLFSCNIIVRIENSYVTAKFAVFDLNGDVSECRISCYNYLKQLLSDLVSELVHIVCVTYQWSGWWHATSLPSTPLSPHDKLLRAVIDILMVIAIFPPVNTRCLQRLVTLLWAMACH